MKLSDLKPGIIVRGPMLPEPVEVLVVTPLGDVVKLTGGGLKLTVTVDVEPPGGTTMSKVEETRVALRELGLPEGVNLKRRSGG